MPTLSIANMSTTIDVRDCVRGEACSAMRRLSSQSAFRMVACCRGTIARSRHNSIEGWALINDGLWFMGGSSRVVVLVVPFLFLWVRGGNGINWFAKLQVCLGMVWLYDYHGGSRSLIHRILLPNESLRSLGGYIYRSVEIIECNRSKVPLLWKC